MEKNKEVMDTDYSVGFWGWEGECVEVEDDMGDRW